ncbi:shikimate O-hydroxycinnamoyltransferase-like [Gossypium arboreum]|nr:shikimate O-hydroxycinnamoyltransferase-like [Gossypium arboreum]
MEVTVKGSNMIFPAQHTPKALSKTLVPFYPMAGRLGCDENGRFQITCNAEGVLWIEAETSSVIDDLAGFTPCSQLQKLVPALDCSGDTTSYPLFMAQWPNNPTPLSVSVFKITQNQLNILKAKSREYENKTNYSIYTILAAYIWRCATKARGLSYDQPTRLLMPTNGRPRLHPPLPSSYLGNVIFMASPIALSGNLQSEPFVNTLGRVHGALARMDNEYLRSVIDYLETLPGENQKLTNVQAYLSTNGVDCLCMMLILAGVVHYTRDQQTLSVKEKYS